VQGYFARNLDSDGKQCVSLSCSYILAPPPLQNFTLCAHWIPLLGLRRSGQCQNKRCPAGQHGKMCCLAQKWASDFRENPPKACLLTSRYNRRGENAVQPECVTLAECINFYGKIGISLCFVDINIQVISLFIWRISFGRMMWLVIDQQSQ
jgi:hypothetical protein